MKVGISVNKEVLDKFDGKSAFIKITAPETLDSANKAILNRRGNVLFNSGDIEAARRIFMTTGYSDGLCRVGDFYNSQGRCVEALQMYWIAPDRVKAEPLIEKLSSIIKNLFNEGVSDEL